MLHCTPPSSDRSLCPATAPLSAVSGILVLDKPENYTSFSVVKEVQKLLGLNRVGHCGTLDPFATGVLVLCLNRATRIADQLLEQDKRYRFTIRFGFESDTLDRTGTIAAVYDGPPPSEAVLEECLASFRGTHEQQVPRYAAVRVGGRRLYAWSRKGIAIPRPRRKVTIHSLGLLAYRWPEAILEAHCSKGTYIRQLAADIGKTLQCGAYVNQLRRLASGPFVIAQAVSLEGLREAREKACWQERVISMNQALGHLPLIRIDAPERVKRLQDGQVDPGLESELQQRFAGQTNPVRLAAGNNELVALWWPRENGQKQRHLRVFGADPRDHTLLS